jgi:hypothetical protein
MIAPAARSRIGGIQIDEIVLHKVSLTVRQWGISIHTCLAVANNPHILKSFDAIMLFEFHRYLFDNLVEDRP